MARARKLAPAREVQEEADEQAEQEQTVLDEMEADELTAQELQFDEPLTWRAGKPIAVSELLRRLQSLAQELTSMQQGMVDRRSVVPKAQELGHTNLLHHKDKGVVAWTMVCIMDIFRLLAPDAPYKQSQLKSVFEVFATTIVPALAIPSDPYNAQHSTVVQSLTKYKSIVLMTDLPGGDELIGDLFRNCFDVLAGTIKGGRGEHLPKSVAYQFTNLLHFIIDELDSLPTGVLDTILAQFLRADPRALAESAIKEFPPSYAMAMTLCNQSETKMSREVGQYFASVLSDASETVSATKPSKSKGKKRTTDALDGEDDLASPPPDLELNELEKAHSLLRELWRAAPGLISNVIPAIEAEMLSSNVHLRVAAVETIGDMIAGIGAAGPPSLVPLDPAAYPSQSLQEGPTIPSYESILLRPNAPRAFSTSYPQEFNSFMGRAFDPSSLVRSTFVTVTSLIISTNAGGTGLEESQETELVQRLSEGLVDSDEKVRLASVRAFAQFDFQTMSQTIAKNGSVDQEGSPLWNLAQRAKDLGREDIRTTAIDLLGRLWGVASGAIAEGNDRINRHFGSIASTILEAMYINKADVNAAVMQAFHEALLPVGYPPIKPPTRIVASQSQSQDQPLQDDPDVVRTERILVLFRSLSDRAKKIITSILSQQGMMSKYMDSLMAESVELYSGSVSKKDRAEREKKIEKFVAALTSKLADPEAAKSDLMKFLKTVDRRNFQLVKFCYDPASDYRRITKAMRELKKNIEGDQNAGSRGVLKTLMPVLRVCALLVYNRSHVPPIMDISRTDEKGLGTAAHEILKEVSSKTPEVFKVHLRELCDSLKRQAPLGPMDPSPGVADTLKACTNFARKFPDEMPKDRDFAKALLAYAKYGNPPKAAKHAVSVLLIVAREKKEMYIKELLDYCISDFSLDDEAALPKLATLAQLQLIATHDIESREDDILDIAANGVLKTSLETDQPDLVWSETIEDSLQARLLALKILVNGIRGLDVSGDPRQAAENVRIPTLRLHTLLHTLIRDEGQLLQDRGMAEFQKARIRLAAASQLLKLSCERVLDTFLQPRDFNELFKLCQDPRPEVRHELWNVLKKYLGPGRLGSRFYAPIFLYAFEPNASVRSNVATWLQSRAAKAALDKASAQYAFVFSRFMSLLAHHPDFQTPGGLFAKLSQAERDESGEGQDLEDFKEIVQYITFFLRTVASEENVSIIFHVAQRLKSVQDGISPKSSDRLYVLSDIAQETIRQYCEVKRWQLATHPKKENLPIRIFAQLPGGEASKRIAERQYVPNEYLEEVEDVVKAALRPKKRKAENISEKSAKKIKGDINGTARKSQKQKTGRAQKKIATPKKRLRDDVPDSERRKSGRAATGVNYAESDESDDDGVLPEAEDEEDEEQVGEEDEEEEANLQDADQAEGDDVAMNGDAASTPPTSSPSPKKNRRPARTKAKARTATRPAPKATRQAPSRSAKPAAAKAKKARDIMDIPSDTDEDMAGA